MPRNDLEIEFFRTSNRFTIKDRPKIRKTGQGEVFFCERKKDGIIYALKRPRLDDWSSKPRQAIELLKKEALAWIILAKHKNIVQALWFDIDKQYRPYIIMEFIRGDSNKDVSLRDLLDRDRVFKQEKAIAIAIGAIDGLTHAKRVMKRELSGKKFVHKDIKPENLLVAEDGQVKVTDFGMVYFEGGTPKYFSPEQWGIHGEVGENRSVEEKTDVYALGCVLFEMIEGEPFFNGQSKHEFENHVKNRPRKARHAVPELAELIFFCLREFPHERPSFTILREKLESIHIRLTGKSLPPPVDNHQLSAEELNARGAGFDELGEYDNALECYNEAIEKDPSDFRFYLNRANTFLSKDNFKEAQENYQQALIIAPRAVEVYLGMGALKAGMKKFEEALECFKKGLEIDKSEPLIFVSLGNLYGQMGYCDEAEFHFRKALALNSGQAEAYFGLGNVQFLRGNSEEALKEYYTALRYNPLYDKALQAIDYIKYPEL